MSQNLRMLINNLWDTSTLSLATGTQIPTLPLLYSQEYGLSKNAAIQSDQGVSVIEFDLASLYYLNGIVMYRHALTNAATWQLELFDGTGQTGNLVYDSGALEHVPTKTLGEWDFLVDTLVASDLDQWPHRFSQLWFDEVFVRSGRLTLTDTEAPDGLHEFNRIYLGRAIQPTCNMSYGHNHQWTSPEKLVELAGGGAYANKKAAYRKFDFSLDHITEAEWPIFTEANQAVGLNRDWFISLYPEKGGLMELQYAMACRYLSQPVTSKPFYNNYSIPISVRES